MRLLESHRRLRSTAGKSRSTNSRPRRRRLLFRSVSPSSSSTSSSATGPVEPHCQQRDDSSSSHDDDTVRSSQSQPAEVIPSTSEDERSLPSTETVAKDLPEVEEAEQQQQTTEKQVRFAPTALAYSNVQTTKEDCAALWYTAADFAMFKEDRAAEAELCVAVENEFLKKRSMDPSQSYSHVLERLFDALCQNKQGETEEDNSVLQKQFQVWIVQTSDFRLGLKRTIVPKLGHDRRDRRQDILEALLDLQEDDYYEHAAYCHQQQPQQAEERTNMMAQASRAMSRPSRLFAQQLGQAVAAAPV